MSWISSARVSGHRVLCPRVAGSGSQSPGFHVLILDHAAVIVDNNFWYNYKVLAAAETKNVKRSC